MTPKETVLEFWARMESNDFNRASELFADDYVLEWPQSSELIRGRELFAQMNNEYPAQGKWHFRINRISADMEPEEGHAVVASDVSVTDGNLNARAITFSYVSKGVIHKQVEFWPDNYPAPPHRAHLVEPLPEGE